MPLMDIGDAQLYYEEYGDGEEVVLASAMGFSGTSYPERLSEAPTGYKVYTIQARGYGRSSRPDEPPAEGWLAQWADDVCAFADRIGVDRFIYTGISHGAGIGWTIARRNPQRLKALVSVVGTPHDRYGVTDSSEGRRKVIEGRHDPAMVRKQMEILAGEPADDPRRREMREIVLQWTVDSHMQRDEREAVINQGMPFPEAKTNEEVEEVLKTIDVPTLILGGMRDGIISPESSIRAGRFVKGAKTILFEDEGHFISRESPERLIREVKVFVDELNGTAEPEPRFFRAEGAQAGTI